MKRILSPQTLTLSAVAGLLFLVSVPRVHQWAVQDNERDAISAIHLLVRPVFGTEVQAAPPDLPVMETLAEALRTRLVDVNYDPTTRLIRRHGYFFDVGRDAEGHAIIRAWPTTHGRTGTHAFLYGLPGGLLRHSDPTGRWSGPEAMPPAGSEPGWQRIPTSP